MSDTVIFGKTVSGTSKKMLLYAGTAVCLGLGGAMMSLTKKEWDDQWWMWRAGWFALQLGTVFNTIKAFYSNSNPTTQQPTP